MNPVIIASLVRHVLTGLGGVFAAKYGVDGETLDGVIGAVSTIIGFGWSVYDKRRLDK
jgi:hypothetical protein